MDNKEKLLKKTIKMVNDVKIYISSTKNKSINYYYLVKKYNNIKLNYHILKNDI